MIMFKLWRHRPTRFQVCYAHKLINNFIVAEVARIAKYFVARSWRSKFRISKQSSYSYFTVLIVVVAQHNASIRFPVTRHRICVTYFGYELMIVFTSTVSCNQTIHWTDHLMLFFENVTPRLRSHIFILNPAIQFPYCSGISHHIVFYFDQRGLP